MGTWEHRAILEGNKRTRTPLGDPHQEIFYRNYNVIASLNDRIL